MVYHRSIKSKTFKVLFDVDNYDDILMYIFFVLVLACSRKLNIFKIDFTDVLQSPGLSSMHDYSIDPEFEKEFVD